MSYIPSYLFKNVFNVLTTSFLILLLRATSFLYAACNEFNLPAAHVPYHLNRLSHDAAAVGAGACWGYEDGCDLERNAFSMPVCPGEHSTYVKDKETQLRTFFNQADFGFIRQQIREQTIMCEPLFQGDSSLECSKYLRFCSGRNIMI
uniref:Uncharacterized protein n=1 Tax=Lutzomyia longipalpis TaxID=7200 RepID=A0A1B0CHE1_LUTLO